MKENLPRAAKDAKSLQEACEIIGISSADINPINAHELPSSYSHSSMDGDSMEGQGVRVSILYEDPEGLLISSRWWVSTVEERDSGETFYFLRETDPKKRAEIRVKIEQKDGIVGREETEMLQAAYSAHVGDRIRAELEELKPVMAAELINWTTPPEHRN